MIAVVDPHRVAPPSTRTMSFKLPKGHPLLPEIKAAIAANDHERVVKLLGDAGHDATALLPPEPDISVEETDDGARGHLRLPVSGESSSRAPG